MGTLRIVSVAHCVFADRAEAGALLADQLADCRSRRPVVLGVPRGGVVVADVVARRLHAQLDVVLARKIGAPRNPETAIGALSETGELLLNDLMVTTFKVTPPYIESRRRVAQAQIDRAQRVYRGLGPRLRLTDRTVIVVDDGAATGATMQAALWAVGQEHPEELIAALPVAPDDSLDKLALHADHTVCLCAAADFEAVAQFYRQFGAVDDETAIGLLRAGAHAQIDPSAA
jgi:predicted phosphoribosyltransferase